MGGWRFRFGWIVTPGSLAVIEDQPAALHGPSDPCLKDGATTESQPREILRDISDAYPSLLVEHPSSRIAMCKSESESYFNRDS